MVGGFEKPSTKTKVACTVFLDSRALDAAKAQKALTLIAGGHVFHDPRDDKRWGGEPKFRWYRVPTLNQAAMAKLESSLVFPRKPRGSV